MKTGMNEKFFFLSQLCLINHMHENLSFVTILGEICTYFCRSTEEELEESDLEKSLNESVKKVLPAERDENMKRERY